MEIESNYGELVVGEVFEPFAELAYEIGSHFNVNSSGPSLVLKFDNPSPTELEQISADHPFEIRFVDLNNILFVTFRCGTLAWCDAPFDPHLEDRPLGLEYPVGDAGYALTLVLADEWGVVRHIRLIPLRAGFSRALCKKISQIMETPVDNATFPLRLQQVYQKYTTLDLVRLSTTYCKIGK